MWPRPGVHQLDRAVAEVDRRDRGEGVVRRHDRGLGDLVGPVVAAIHRRCLHLLAVGDGVERCHLVGGDRDLAVLLAEGRVAEDVVDVLVGVHQPHHRPRGEPAEVGDDLRGRLGRGVGVDDEQAGLALDHGDVDVVPLVARDPDPVRHLCELRHGREPTSPSSIGTLDTTSAKVGDGRTSTRRRDAGGPQARRAPRDRRGLRRPRGSRSAARRSSSGTGSASRRRRSATTWPRWRRRG